MSARVFDIGPEFKQQARFYITTGASLFTALALFETLKFQNKIITNKKSRRLLESGDITKPSNITTKNKGSLVIVSGQLDTTDNKSILKRINQKNESLALYLRYNESIFSNESYDLKKNDYHINLHEILKGSHLDFNTTCVLKDSQGQMKIKNLDKIDFSPALEIMKWENNKRKLSFSEDLTVLLMAVLRGIATIGVKDDNVTFLRGINVGERNVEAGLKIGATLTVLGTVGLDSNGGLFIEPSALFKERLSFIHDLNVEYEELISKRNVWLGLFVVGAVYLGRRAYRYVKRNNIKMPWDGLWGSRNGKGGERELTDDDLI